MSKGQRTVLADMAQGHLLLLHKLDKKATVNGRKVNLLTFFALRDSEQIAIVERGDAITTYGMTQAGVEALDEQEGS